MSHIKHAWYDSHDVVHHQRMDKVAKTILLNRISQATSAGRPQTTNSLLNRREKKCLIPMKRKEKDRGMDGVIQDRKNFLLRGNGNITGFYNDPSGIISSYQQNYKPYKSAKIIQKTAGNLYTSSIMVVTPDPGQFAKVGKRQDRFKADITATSKKLKRTDSALQKAMGRVMGYQHYQKRNMLNQQISGLRIDGSAFGDGMSHPGFVKTPLDDKYKHLMPSR